MLARVGRRVRPRRWFSTNVRADENVRIMQLIQAYKDHGHLLADVDPLRLAQTDPLRGAPFYLQDVPLLQPETYGLVAGNSRSEKRYWIGDSLAPVLGGNELHSFTDIMSTLRKVYCGSVGVQFSHVQQINEKEWLNRRILEHSLFKWSPWQKLQMLEQIANATYFEEFYGKRLSGAKRFSLEGCDALIPGLESLLERSSELGITSIELGMAHRGRLNVLKTIFKVPLETLLHNFQSYLPDDGEHPNNSDDVRYHLGTSTVREFSGGKAIRISLAANPSHLECINSVVLGKTRARQFLIRGETFDEGDNQHLDRLALRRGSIDYSPSDHARGQAMTVLLHGDASFFQGSVREILGFSGLRDYKTGGTVHLIINNQIGFTTLPKESFSGTYCSDVALSVGAPVFHVNGDDPEAVAMVCRTAVEYRQAFQKDCVIDLWGYRRHGHNEQDDPKLTQPIMYSKIENHPRLCDAYGAKLADEGVFAKGGSLKGIKERIWSTFESTGGGQPGSWNEFGALTPGPNQASDKKALQRKLLKNLTTGVEVELLRVYGESVFTLPVPAQFRAHPAVAKIYGQRLRSVEVGAGHTIRWATAEALAFASLLAEGFHVRLSGQDVERGTFNQRHAVVYDQQRSVHGNEVFYKPWTGLQGLEDSLSGVRENMMKRMDSRTDGVRANTRAVVIDGDDYYYDDDDEEEEEEEKGKGEEREKVDYRYFPSVEEEKKEREESMHVGHYHFNNDQTGEEEELGLGHAKTGRKGLYNNAGHYSFQIPKKNTTAQQKQNGTPQDQADELEIDVEVKRIQQGVRLRRQQRMDSKRVLQWREPGGRKQGPIGEMEVCNSPLSEEAVLGFEHGYSLYSPNILTVFEHQFGDFSNCAQPVIDTFVASGEEKWVRSSGMVILCPHGYEGQGPDHSSARVERFLQLCSEPPTPAEFPKDRASENSALATANMHVLNMTTPAQYFHALRRHMLLPIRKPLIIFTPKYLLHHRPCASSLEQFGPDHTFDPVLADHDATVGSAKRVLLCSGKIYYHLSHRRKMNKQDSDVAIIRVEQICPFPFHSLQEQLRPYLCEDRKVELVWVQEEPQNMGCWTYVEPRVRTTLLHMDQNSMISRPNQAALKDASWSNAGPLRYIGRPCSASPATGSFQVHQKEMNAILTAALSDSCT